MTALTIANTHIRRDTAGRYCLNDLHRASGGEQRHQPRYWLANQQTQDLIEEMGDSGIPLSVQKGGTQQGTYVAKELVYAYAMWISARFHLRVIRAYDAMATQPQPDPMEALSDPATMRGLLLTYADKVLALESTAAKQAPKAAALDRITNQPGHHNLRNTAKLLGIPERRLITWLRRHHWIYRDRHGRLCARSHRLHHGQMDTAICQIQTRNGPKAVAQPMVTQKGLTHLAQTIHPNTQSDQAHPQRSQAGCDAMSSSRRTRTGK